MQRIITTIRKIAAELSSVKVPVYSANAAFFLLLSIFPAMLFLLSITQYTVISMDGIIDFLSPILPEVLLPLVNYILDDLRAVNPVSILSISTIMLLWSASKGVYGLVKGINQASHLKETRPYWRVRLACVFYTAVVLGALIGMVALYSVSDSLLKAIFIEGSFIHRLLATILHFRWYVAGILLLIVFSLIYMFFPCEKSKLRQIFPGSIASAAGWIIFSSLFSKYVKMASSYSSVYGSISVIALTMLWLYICMNILFYGAMLNHYLRYHRNMMAQWLG